MIFFHLISSQILPLFNIYYNKADTYQHASGSSCQCPVEDLEEFLEDTIAIDPANNMFPIAPLDPWRNFGIKYCSFIICRYKFYSVDRVRVIVRLVEAKLRPHYVMSDVQDNT